MLLLLGASWCAAGGAEVRLVPASEPQHVFAGSRRQLKVFWENTGRGSAQVEIWTRVFQASSETAVPIGQGPWKTLSLLASQTVLESIDLDFPSVKAPTEFLVQWLEMTNRVLGLTTVWVYPTNLLEELRSLGGGRPVGVLGPDERFKRLLEANRVELVDLSIAGTADFQGKLVIIAASRPLEQRPERLAESAKELARTGAAVVWIQPPRGPHQPLQPSFFTHREGAGAVVVAQAALVADLLENPLAQMNLLHLCRLAVRPEAPQFPSSDSRTH